MKTITSTASTIFSVIRHLPQILVIVGKIREVLGDERIQSLFASIKDLLEKTSPPAPTADSAGTQPANIEEEKRRRWWRFRNRIIVAESLTDTEAQEFCHQHHIDHYTIA